MQRYVIKQYSVLQRGYSYLFEWVRRLFVANESLTHPWPFGSAHTGRECAPMAMPSRLLHELSRRNVEKAFAHLYVNILM
jgi:hypothetical protein